MNFLAAIGFLTIIPVPARAVKEDGNQILYFPLVGLFIGCLLIGVDYLLSLTSQLEYRVVGDALFLTIITGALHLDGLADTADGFFSHRPKEEILKIMKDSRIGVMGVLALLFCILLKLAGIAAIIRTDSLIWLILAPALGRVAQVVGLVFVDHVSSEKILAELFYQRGKYYLLLLCPLPFLIIFYLNVVLALASLGFFILLIFGLLIFCKNKIGGITGDTLGAITEIIETVFLLIGGMGASFL